MTYEEEYLRELFALPIKTELIAKLESQPIYSTRKLVIKYIKAMMKRKETAPISKKIIDLIKKEKLNPCWVNKGIFSLSLFKIFGGTDKMTMAFYYPPENKIFLLMDNNIIFGYASNKNLAKLTIHEGMHMAANNMKKRFLSHFEDELMAYYSKFFAEIFALNKKHKDFKKTIKNAYTFMFNEIETVEEPDTKKIIAKYI
jgi:hypothetical protein